MPWIARPLLNPALSIGQTIINNGTLSNLPAEGIVVHEVLQMSSQHEWRSSLLVHYAVVLSVFSQLFRTPSVHLFEHRVHRSDRYMDTEVIFF